MKGVGSLRGEAARSLSIVRACIAWTVGTFLVCVLLAPSAHAAFGLSAFDGAARDQAGEAFAQAGGHPYDLTTTFVMKTIIDSTGNVAPDGGAVKDIEVDLPSGLIGNPSAVKQCPIGVFLITTTGGFTCPPSSQVGLVTVQIAQGPDTGSLPPWPVYNLEPSPGAVASFAFTVVGVPVFLDAFVTAEKGYHVKAVVRDTSEAIEVVGSTLTLWGMPSDPSHDTQRACQGQAVFGCLTERGEPFLTLPTSCPPPGEALETRLRANSWTNPGVFAEATFLSHDPPGYPLPPSQWGPPQGPMGCEELPFAPSISARPDSTLPDSPSGLAVELAFPQDGLLSEKGLATAHLRRARVTLPDGMTISPSSADGLQACTDAEAGIGNDAPAACPAESKIGTVTATTPVLDDPLEGGLYVREQKSSDPASGEMFRILLAVQDLQRGIVVKLPGQVRVDPASGRIETIFDDNPQVPVSTISLRLKAGPRAPLATPPDCGTKTVEAELTSWAGQTVHLSDSFSIDCVPGMGGFDPAFAAGSLSPTAGAFSPFVVSVDRPDRQQYLSGVALEMPGGMLARLKGVPLCADADAAAGSCPAATRIGTATVGAGPGSNPYYLKGFVSLTGPYGGGPYGLSVAVRVVSWSVRPRRRGRAPSHPGRSGRRPSRRPLRSASGHREGRASPSPVDRR